MTDHSVNELTRADDAMVEGAIRRGASRRELCGCSRRVAPARRGRLDPGPRLGRARRDPGDGRLPEGRRLHRLDADARLGQGRERTDYTRACAYYNRLTFLNETSEVQMELAESVETTDAKVWTVTLKPGVEFHDGKTLSSEDVAFSPAATWTRRSAPR